MGQLLDALDDGQPAAPPAAEAPAAAPPAAMDDDDLFDMGGDSTAASDDEITEDEFEALLDQILGKGKHAAADSKPSEPEKPAAADTEAAVAGAASGDDLIKSNKKKNA